jgi:hypothetical protein
VKPIVKRGVVVSGREKRKKGEESRLRWEGLKREDFFGYGKSLRG